MPDAVTEFERLAERFVTANADVGRGRMMSAPGLQRNGKVFAFQHKTGMGFRLGESFDPKNFGLKNPRLLNPFKTKGPLKGWYVVAADQIDLWERLTERALAFTRTL